MNDTTDETSPLGGPPPEQQTGQQTGQHPGQHPGAQTGGGAAYSRRSLEALDQLRRSRSDRHIAGVAGGLGRHFGIDPTVLRVLLVILVFFGGAGLVLYGAVWLFVPEEGAERATFSTTPETRRTALIVAAIVAGCLAIGDSVNGFGFGWPLALVALVVGVYLVARDRRDPTSAGPHHPSWAAGPAAAQTTVPEEGATMSTTYPPAGAGTEAGEPPAWQPPTGQPPAYRPPRRPRRTGIIWFWPTLALIAIGWGILGVYDADHVVANGAYPALALAIIGVMLVVGAVRGRPGGLILLGVLGALTLAATTVTGDSFGTDARQIELAPTTAAAVQPEYHASVGRIELDLTGVRDLTALQGRSLDLELRTGEIHVIVPRELNVAIEADVEYAGGISVPGDDGGGIGHSVDKYLAGQPATDTAPLELDLETKFGQITVEQR
ncbi:MAG TPA: PspC domain-containing protein [Marmoricola sp.]|nr:PspC domain-containing protein [Marmoricola sp.]